MSRGNGRVGRVRDYLAEVKTARSATEVRRAVDPNASLTVICNTLSYMAQRGYVEQLGRGKGKARFRIGKQAPPSRERSVNGTARIVNKAPPPRGRTRSNFTAAPGTVSDRPRHLLSASERIADDIAAFKKRGGKIEVLGITQVFRVTAADNDDVDD